jgi:mono/diheme cytochrome c family protein
MTPGNVRERGDSTTKVPSMRVLIIGSILVSSTCPLFAALSPSAQRGLALARVNCARCHAIDKVSESPLRLAPPFRTLHERYPVEFLQEPIGIGGRLTTPPLPHHRTYGSVYGGSVN